MSRIYLDLDLVTIDRGDLLAVVPLGEDPGTFSFVPWALSFGVNLSEPLGPGVNLTVTRP